MSAREPIIIDAIPERVQRGAPHAQHDATPHADTRTQNTTSAAPKRATWKRVAIGALALLYVLSPLDLVPDWFPVVGWLDDIGVLAWAARQVFFKRND
jgi:uncharacterized membrane protein YkvA (DUF1232 family)